MKTVNSLSGGKTSSYLAVHYPADYDIFALVRTNDKSCLFPDAKVRQMVSDRIGTEFIGTLEMDEIIYTMLDLEQFMGREITWVTAKPFDEIMNSYKGKNGKFFLPNQYNRYCTTDLKVKPIAQWIYENTELPVDMRIGFRANEMRRAMTMIDRQVDGIEIFKFKIGGSKNGRKKWKNLPYRTCSFPLINDGIFKDNIEAFWKDKPVRFAKHNNCVGCFNQNPILLNIRANDKKTCSSKKFNWFMMQEIMNDSYFGKIPYVKIRNHKLQLDLFDDDFNDCDSGYCGI
jgi:hypothetical protein